MKKIFNKKTILVFGIGLLFVINYNFNNTLAVTCPDTINWDNTAGVCIPINTGLPEAGGGFDPMVTVATSVMQWLLQIVGVVAVIAFVVSGIQYLTSAGNESQIETAKRNMWWSIVGVIVALSGLIILNFIDDMLGSSYSSSGGGGNTANSSSTTTPTQNSSGTSTWINPDTGLPYNDSAANSSSGGGGNTANSSSTTTPTQNSSGTSTWINPDTGLPYNDSAVNNTTSAEIGENIVNSAINNSATTVPNSPLSNTGLPIAE